VLALMVELAPAAKSAHAQQQPRPRPASDQAPPPPGRMEANFVPIVGGDSDVGIGVGQFSSLARLEPGFTPFRWRAESAAFLTFRPTGASLEVPYQDYFVMAAIPEIGPDRRYRLDVRPSFTRETTLRYHGMGNASPNLPTGTPGRVGQYERAHPTLLVGLQRQATRRLSVQLGSTAIYNWFEVPPGSRLATDIARADTVPELEPLRGATSPHAVYLLELSLLYDTRDSELAPDRGSFHELQARVSPGGLSFMPYRYGQLTLKLHANRTFIDRYLIFSSRVVGDVLFGDPPFYELARYEQTSAIGGIKGVRGVPSHRYYGKIKVFGNLEVRSEVFGFRVRKKQYVISVAGFFDSGRVWTDFSAPAAFDGAGWGLKYGAGGGLRLQSGETFLLRADLAYSPDADPLAGYFTSGLIFF
jgi:hypothetical protein